MPKKNKLTNPLLVKKPVKNPKSITSLLMEPSYGTQGDLLTIAWRFGTGSQTDHPKYQVEAYIYSDTNETQLIYGGDATLADLYPISRDSSNLWLGLISKRLFVKMK